MAKIMGVLNTSFTHNLLKCLLSMSLLFLAAKAITNPEIEDESPISYDMEAANGPQNWGNLNPNWTLCGTGRSQSPINILSWRAVARPFLGDLDRRYKPGLAVIINRGRDIEVEWVGDAGGIVINGSQYQLVQSHWHIPSEHTVNGVRFNMELHMVHVDSRGSVAVVGILYRIGKPDPFLKQLLPQLELADEEGVDLGLINPSDIKIKGRKYYRYTGSLTTPPCSENIIWTVFEKMRSVSREQIRALRDAVDDDGCIGNARPIQPLNGRTVYFYQQIQCTE